MSAAAWEAAAMRAVQRIRARTSTPSEGLVWIYFIQEGDDGPVKIGSTTKTVERRLSALQGSNPRELRLLAAVQTGVALEREFHEVFAEHRIRGEWFHPHEDILDMARIIREECQ